MTKLQKGERGFRKKSKRWTKRVKQNCSDLTVDWEEKGQMSKVDFSFIAGVQLGSLGIKN